MNWKKKLITILLFLVLSLQCFAEAKINEIMYDPPGSDAGAEWIELYFEKGAIVGGWTIVNNIGQIIAVLPDWAIPPDSYFIIYLGVGSHDNNFIDGSGYYYTGNPLEFLDNDMDDLSLYAGIQDPSLLIDFVAWGNTGYYNPGTGHEHAVLAGIWIPDQYFTNTECCMDKEESIGRDFMSTDTNTPEDWYGCGGVNTDNSTPGKDNDAFNHLDKTINGVVRTPDGTPLSDVRVMIAATGEETYTVDGAYSLNCSLVGEIPVVFSKPGYVINTRVVPVTNHDYSFYDVVLVSENPGTLVGSDGGIITIGEYIINIPPGALTDPVEITLTEIPNIAYPETEVPDFSSLPLNAIKLGPAGLHFNVPIQITMPITYMGADLDTQSLNPDEVGFSYFNENTLTWEPAGPAILEPDLMHVTITVDHFSVVKTETFWYYWYIKIFDKGQEDDPASQWYEGNSYCGMPFNKTITRSVTVTISADIGCGYGPLSASIGASVSETKTVTLVFNDTSGPCEEREYYSYVRYKKWEGEYWSQPSRVGSSLFSPSGWTYEGAFSVRVPQGLRVIYKSIDRTDPCCPPTPSPSPVPTPVISGCMWVDPDEKTALVGTGFTNGINLNSGVQSLAIYNVTVGYDNNIIELDIAQGINGVEPGLDGFVTEVLPLGPGLVSINGFDAMGTIPGDNLSIINIHWLALHAGVSDITLMVEQLLDINSMPIEGMPCSMLGRVNVIPSEILPNTKINEIMYDPPGSDAGAEWIELYFDEETPVSGWTIVDNIGGVIATLPDWTIPQDSYLVIHFGMGTNNNDFSNGNGYFYTGNPGEFLDNDIGDLALYTGPSDPYSIIDFVAWGNTGYYNPGINHDHALMANIWMPGQFFTNTECCMDKEESIGRDYRSTDTNAPEDWYGCGGINTDTSTPGKDNDAFNHLDKTISGVVRTPDGTELSDVRVMIAATGEEMYTVDGVYSLNSSLLGEVPVVFSKPGYVINTRVVPVTNHDYSFYDVVMVPENPGTLVGPDGGIITIGEYIINIPPDALTDPVEITLTEIPNIACPETEVFDTSSLPLNAIKMGPAGLNFNIPVQITMPITYMGADLDTQSLNPDEVGFSYFNENTLTWEPGGPAILEPDRLHVTVEVDHFSIIRTNTFWYAWIIDLTDLGYEDDDTSGGWYEGNSYCGMPFNKTITHSVTVTISADIGCGYGPLSASIGASVSETKTVTLVFSDTSGPCEEREYYSYVRYKEWLGFHWSSPRRVGSALFSSSGWTWEGAFKVLVPQGLRVIYKSIDRTDPCCPSASPSPVPTPVISGCMRVEPDNQTATVGTGFSNEIKLDSGGQSLAMYASTINYDINIIELDILQGINGVEPGPDGFVTEVLPMGPGLVAINGFDPMGTIPGSNLSIVNLHWIAVGEGVSDIMLMVEDMADVNGLPISEIPCASTGMITITPPEILIGDVNGDSNINILDALLIAQYYVGLDPPAYTAPLLTGDTNCDGKVNILDALLTAQYYVGLDPPAWCGV